TDSADSFAHLREPLETCLPTRTIKTPPSEEMLQRRQVELRVDARIVAGGLLVVLMVSRIRMMLRGHMRNSECRVVQQVRARQSAVAMQIGFPGKRQRHIADCQLRTDDRIPVSALVAGAAIADQLKCNRRNILEVTR